MCRSEFYFCRNFLKLLYKVESFHDVNSLSLLSSLWALFEPCDWSMQCDVTQRRAMSLFFNYTYLLSSLIVHKVQIIVNISCLVPLESSSAVQYDYTYISYLTRLKNDYWKKSSQISSHTHGEVMSAVPDMSSFIFHLRYFLHQTAQTRSTNTCLLYTSPSPRDRTRSRMPSSA